MVSDGSFFLFVPCFGDETSLAIPLLWSITSYFSPGEYFSCSCHSLETSEDCNFIDLSKYTGNIMYMVSSEKYT